MEDNFKEVWSRVAASNNALSPDRINAEFMSAGNSIGTRNQGSGSLYRPLNEYIPDTFDLKRTLEDFIEDETADSAYYSALAARTMRNNARMVFNRLSAAEKRHARRLQTAYFLLTGNSYTAKRPAPTPPRSMLEALRQRYTAELNGAKAYAGAASKTDNQEMKELFTELSADELRHAADIKRLVEESME